MNKPIGSIAWPKQSQDAARLLLLYMIEVVERLNISFGSSPHEPVSVVKAFLAWESSEDQRRAALDHWWAVVDKEGIRNLEGRDALIARLAVCLLAPTQADTSNLGEQLSWFLEVLGFLGVDVDKAIDAMEEHFSFY